MTTNYQEIAKSEARLESVIVEKLHEIGHTIASLKNYKNVDGVDAIRYYLMEKHHWLPSQVKAMSFEDLDFCILEENFKFFYGDSDLS